MCLAPRSDNFNGLTTEIGSILIIEMCRTTRSRIRGRKNKKFFEKAHMDKENLSRRYMKNSCCC